jgi:uncharacterized membrane protein YkvA (DUF1232 family)
MAIDPQRVADPDSEGPSQGLLSFYDRLRARVLRATRERGRLVAGATELLLVVPDVFMLLLRLTLDSEVPASTRSLVGGALLYFVVPLDLFPEGVVGVGGFVEDLVIAAAVLSHALSDELEPLVERHWSGPRELRAVLRDTSTAASTLLGENLYARVRALLRRRGIEVADAPASGGARRDDTGR